MLKIHDAIKLYALLKDYLPDSKNFDNYLDYSGIIIHNIRESSRPETFGECLLLMYPDEDAQTLLDKDSLMIIELFVQGLVNNKILDLVEFCTGINYGVIG